MNVDKKTVLITGANRGIGQALVSEALRRGATRVYAGSRGQLQHPDERVTALMLDVTSVSQIREAVDRVDTLDVLINNAGIALYDDLSNREVIEQHLATIGARAQTPAQRQRWRRCTSRRGTRSARIGIPTSRRRFTGSKPPSAFPSRAAVGC